ncbi:hypothetical protein [Erythrobacter sp. R86502]|uniref:hypothetical protein n=1 Tax=Erythrobacter sp. R86502 TaxID=3093846 RepID=UPI0036D2AE24
MKTSATFVIAAGSVLALAACNPDPAETPVEPVTSETMAPATAATDTVMDPAMDPAVDPAEAADEGFDPTSNPIRPQAPADGNETAPSSE